MVANPTTCTKSFSRAGRKEGNTMNVDEVKVRIASLNEEGDEFRTSLMFLRDDWGPSDVRIRLNKWVTKVVLLVEELLPRDRLIVDKMREMLNKSKGLKDEFECAMGVLMALEGEINSGRLNV